MQGALRTYFLFVFMAHSLGTRTNLLNVIDTVDASCMMN